MFIRLAPRSVRFSRRRTGLWLGVEVLETRDCPSSFTPTQIQHAYGVDITTLDDGSGTFAIPADGNGQTVAIVVAYDAPNIANDLGTFSTNYNLPSATFTKVKINNPPSNAGWAEEASLDVEWVHAIAPAANIVLFEAHSASDSDLLAAVDQARNYSGVSVVSMSWGSGEFSLETNSTYQNHFTTPADHQGVTFVAASGDSGNRSSHPIWPSISTNVVSVGGTSLYLNSDDSYNYETGWNNGYYGVGGSGGGQSSYFTTAPDYQSAFTGLTRRSSPEVAFVGDPYTGVDVVYNGHTYVFGGTSASAPIFAGVMALVNEQRTLLNYGTFDGPSETLPNLYSLTAGTDYNSITTNPNATNSMITTVGLGSPMVNNFVHDLAYIGISSAAPAAATGGGGGGSGTGSGSGPGALVLSPVGADAPANDGTGSKSSFAPADSSRATDLLGNAAPVLSSYAAWPSDDGAGSLPNATDASARATAGFADLPAAFADSDLIHSNKSSGWLRMTADDASGGPLDLAGDATFTLPGDGSWS